MEIALDELQVVLPTFGHRSLSQEISIIIQQTQGRLVIRSRLDGNIVRPDRVDAPISPTSQRMTLQARGAEMFFSS